MELRSNTEFEFTYISSEMSRTYIFAEDSVTIVGPCWLAASKSGGHLILDSRGICWYIPPRWLGLAWKVPDDKLHFVK